MYADSFQAANVFMGRSLVYYLLYCQQESFIWYQLQDSNGTVVWKSSILFRHKDLWLSNIYSYQQGKLEPRALKSVYLGYPKGVKGYKIWCTNL